MATAKKTPLKRKAPIRRAPAKPAARLPPPPVPRKPAAKPVQTAKAAAPKAPAPTVVKAEKLDKDKKPKLVRDSFTIPKPEYAVLEALKERAARLGRPTKKSELLRAGVKALAAMSDAAFLAGVGAVPAVKTGRPAKS